MEFPCYALDDTANNDLLEMDINMQGVWQNVLNSNVDYSYDYNNNLQVKLYADGDYKINYQG